MNMNQTQLIVAPTTVVQLASVSYVTAQGSMIEYQYTIGIVSLTTHLVGINLTAYNQNIMESDMK